MVAAVNRPGRAGRRENTQPGVQVTETAGHLALEELQAKIRLLKRQEKILAAKDRFIDFVTFTLPDPSDPDDVDKSAYQVKKHHAAIARVMEDVEAGKIKRLIVTLPPRAGKSELISRRFIAWALGRNPSRQIAFATYNDDFADEFGADVRAIMLGPQYKQVFENVRFRKGEASKGALRTTARGAAMFVGRGGGLTGKGADILVIDDLIKDDKEAESPTIRDQAWNWFNKVATTRLMGDHACIVIVMTRWHEDDVVGRLTDRNNKHWNAIEAKAWKIINIPAIANDNDSLGRKPGELLWPERFSAEFLQSYRRRDPRGFSALYQQEPTVADGDYFKREFFQYYKAGQLPDDLRIYAASDHSIGKDKTRSDYTVILVVGIDAQSNIYLLDLWRARADTRIVVERMIDVMKRWKPILWWAERDHITGSIGPFLRKRMQETGTWNAIVEVSSASNKEAKAQSIQGRTAGGKVYFPFNVPWVPAFESELLKFPHGTHDDQVDAFGLIGRGVSTFIAAEAPKKDAGVLPGTFGYLKLVSKIADREKKRAGSRGGQAW